MLVPLPKVSLVNPTGFPNSNLLMACYLSSKVSRLLSFQGVVVVVGQMEEVEVGHIREEVAGCCW